MAEAHGTHGEQGKDEDHKLQRRFEELLPHLCGWRLALLTTGRSTFGAGAAWAQPTPEGCVWSDWRGSLGAFGGASNVQAHLHLRGLWPRRVSPRDWHDDHHVDPTASAQKMQQIWG